MILADLNSRKRVEVVGLTLAPILQRLAEPADTVAIVNAVCAALETDERKLVARTLMGLARSHPSAHQVGEPFTRYGQTMRRWEWRPAPKRRGFASVEERRAAQAAAEAEDPWTIRPEDGK